MKIKTQIMTTQQSIHEMGDALLGRDPETNYFFRLYKLNKPMQDIIEDVQTMGGDLTTLYEQFASIPDRVETIEEYNMTAEHNLSNGNLTIRIADAANNTKMSATVDLPTENIVDPDRCYFDEATQEIVLVFLGSTNDVRIPVSSLVTNMVTSAAHLTADRVVVGDNLRNVKASTIPVSNISLKSEVYTKGQVDLMLDDIEYKDITAQNLVANGDFLIAKPSPNENQALGFFYANFTDATLSGGIAKFTATAQYGRIQYSITYPLNHKIYYFAKVKATSPLVSLSGVMNKSQAHTYHSGSNNFEFLSNLQTADGTFNSMQVSDFRTTGFTPIEVDYIGAIDLTETFGAGNEPSKEQMDAVMALNGGFIPETPTSILDLKKLFILICKGAL